MVKLQLTMWSFHEKGKIVTGAVRVVELPPLLATSMALPG